METIHTLLDTFKQSRDFTLVMPKLKKDADFRAELLAQIEPGIYPYAEYASWIAAHFFEKNRSFLPEWTPLLKRVLATTTNHTVQRNLVHLFIKGRNKLQEDGEFLQLLFGFLESNESLPALKVNAFKVIEKQYLGTYPELLAELKLLMDLHAEDTRPSIASMRRNFYKRYDKRLQRLR